MIPLRKSDDLSSWVERSFGHDFATPALCHAALTHRSAGAEHNERLEFLGDSILNCAVARMLFDAHPLADEGALSRLRASLVSGGFRRASILADALEAILGAIFLDAGFDAAAAAVARIIGPKMSDLPAADALKDPKTRLQEVLQAGGLALPTYTLTAVGGNPHSQSFTVMCEVPVFGVAATIDRIDFVRPVSAHVATLQQPSA